MAGVKPSEIDVAQLYDNFRGGDLLPSSGLDMRAS